MTTKTQPSKSRDLFMMWSSDKRKKLISTLTQYTIPMAIKLGRVVTYIAGNSPTNSHNLLITWSREKWKTL